MLTVGISAKVVVPCSKEMIAIRSSTNVGEYICKETVRSNFQWATIGKQS